MRSKRSCGARQETDAPRPLGRRPLTMCGRLWHNAGAVGLPANDGTPRGWFSLITPIDGGLQIEHRALTYDHATSAESMLRHGLRPEYRITLSTGIWPSCDVLPYTEIRDRGVPLAPGTCVWRPVKPSRQRRRGQLIAAALLWPSKKPSTRQLDARKFRDPDVTARNEARAKVPLLALKTLWFNTGTLCNITCRNCYIESSPALLDEGRRGREYELIDLSNASMDDRQEASVEFEINRRGSCASQRRASSSTWELA